MKPVRYAEEDDEIQYRGVVEVCEWHPIQWKEKEEDPAECKEAVRKGWRCGWFRMDSVVSARKELEKKIEKEREFWREEWNKKVERWRECERLKAEKRRVRG